MCLTLVRVAKQSRGSPKRASGHYKCFRKVGEEFRGRNEVKASVLYPFFDRAGNGVS